MLTPSRPGPDDFGRLFAHDGIQYLTDCRWCAAPLKRNLHEGGALVCTTCDVPAGVDYPHSSTTD